MLTKVSIVKGEDVPAMVAKAIEHLGGIEQFVSPGDVVLIKPNSFVKQAPANGNVARPEVVVALAKLVKDAGAKRVVIGERNDAAVIANFEGTGYEDAAELMPFDAAEHVTVNIEGTKSLQMPVTVPKILLDCDKHMTVPVGKTHCGAGVTACLKNAMGLMMGGETRKSHAYGVSSVPIDVNSIKWPVLGLADMTISQEGNFPGAGGDPVPMGVLVVSGDIVAADATCARLMGYEPEDVWIIRSAAQRGKGVMASEDIAIFGDPIEEVGRKLTGVVFDPDEFGDQVNWCVDTRCPYCIQDAVSFLRTDGGKKLLAKTGGLNIIAGPVSDCNVDEERTTLVIGNCNSWLMDKGEFVHGCPPAVFHIGERVKGILAE